MEEHVPLALVEYNAIVDPDLQDHFVNIPVSNSFFIIAQPVPF